jgi:hypothetical protein
MRGGIAAARQASVAMAGQCIGVAAGAMGREAIGFVAPSRKRGAAISWNAPDASVASVVGRSRGGGPGLTLVTLARSPNRWAGGRPVEPA